MSLEHILIGLLRQPSSGYDLKKVFDERIDYFWAAELSQIYPTLKRLEKRGWVRCRQAASSRGPGRRVYETTAAGRRALRDWLAKGPEIGDERFAYLAQIYLMDELADLKQTLRFFTVLRDEFNRKREALRRLERYWAEADPRYPEELPPPDFHVQLTLRMGILSLGGHVRSCDESIRRLRARMVREKHTPRGVSKSTRHKNPRTPPRHKIASRPSHRKAKPPRARP
jgi:PadR family transcriptional regulator, phenolic acid-responsive transcriptional regulator